MWRSVSSAPMAGPIPGVTRQQIKVDVNNGLRAGIEARHVCKSCLPVESIRAGEQHVIGPSG